MNNTERNVLITGASSGIGREFAKIFADRGYNIVLAARSRERLEEIKREINGRVKAEIVTIDLSERDSAERLYSKVKELGITIDILINNAGYGLEGTAYELPLEKQVNMIDLNVVTMTKIACIFSRDMIKNGFGRILNVGSIASFFPTPLMSVYSATKAYIFSFSQSLNTELSGRGDISVTALCPGPVRTNFCKTADVDKLRGFFESLFINPDKAAMTGYKALMAKKTIAVPAFPVKILVFMGRFMPWSVINKILEHISR